MLFTFSNFRNTPSSFFPMNCSLNMLFLCSFLYLDEMSSVQFYAYSAKYVCNPTCAAHFCFLLFGNLNMETLFLLMYSRYESLSIIDPSLDNWSISNTPRIPTHILAYLLIKIRKCLKKSR
jgi:hypothetical protein